MRAERNTGSFQNCRIGSTGDGTRSDLATEGIHTCHNGKVRKMKLN